MFCERRPTEEFPPNPRRSTTHTTQWRELAALVNPFQTLALAIKRTVAARVLCTVPPFFVNRVVAVAVVVVIVTLTIVAVLLML